MGPVDDRIAGPPLDWRGRELVRKAQTANPAGERTQALSRLLCPPIRGTPKLRRRGAGGRPRGLPVAGRAGEGAAGPGRRERSAGPGPRCVLVVLPPIRRPPGEDGRRLPHGGHHLLSLLHVHEACEGRDGRVEHVHTSGGTIAADLVLLSAGVRPNVGLAAAAGVQLGATGAIAVDEWQQTNLPRVYAAGDCAEHFHRILQKPAYVPLGTTANKQGRVAGRNAAGGRATFAGIVGTAVLNVFDLGVARTGLSEREARLAGVAYEAVVLESADQAGYMPDATALTVKLVAEKETGRLLGAQAVGRHGADKRVDVLATALYAGLTLAQLEDLDLAYAPPFNSVWDPVQAAATHLRRNAPA
ncbi:MAG: FAD-dependent oxidoreductase [Gemmatimonadetes bacterium]|nr:FAD-dependent oxidoreductase [Gemmatimonadota bacterium]